MPHAKTIYMGDQQGQHNLKPKGKCLEIALSMEWEETDRIKIEIVYQAKAITHWDKDETEG